MNIPWAHEARIAWCEAQLLQDIPDSEVSVPQTLPEQLAMLMPDPAYHEKLLPYLERREVPAGTLLAQEGELSHALFWVESGRLRAQIKLRDDVQHRVRVAQAGAVIGEMALYAEQTRSASIVADEPSVVYVLSKAALDRMEHENPEVASMFHRMIANILSERLADTTHRLQHHL